MNENLNLQQFQPVQRFRYGMDEPLVRSHGEGKQAYRLEQGPGYREVTAHSPRGKLVGFINWHDPDPQYPGLRDTSVVHRVQVDERHRRRGLASAMYEMAREIQPTLKHSHALTTDGLAWTRGLKDKGVD